MESCLLDFLSGEGQHRQVKLDGTLAASVSVSMGYHIVLAV